LGLGKGCKVRNFLLEIDNYYDVQRAQKGQQGFQRGYLFYNLRA
jgi:hypothetical protein